MTPLAVALAVLAAPPSLQVGDPAPALSVSTWLQGGPVKKFEPGRVYVVEFWATWCAPCIRQMPRLAKLHARHKGRVTVIGVTARDILVQGMGVGIA